jgi:hypothetical protein
MGHALSRLFDKRDLDTSDVTAMARALLALVARLPTFKEIGDFTSILTGGWERTA